ncbi:MAG TPA: permease prefix domain 1-containing protein [Acidimicrobiales bacterium]|nr:permease prefix domain 1-containing protein [Acidimicrobiales bacterium]
MAEPGLIAAYLRELRYSTARLHDVDDIVDEVEDHLTEHAHALVARGVSRAEAEAAAIARFGSAELVARVFIEERKRGGAVSTTSTRRAGLAAMLAPLLTIVGAIGNEAIDRGALHGVAVGMILAGCVAFAIALWGLRVRHGGLGGIGTAALVVFVAAPFVSIPFLWAAAAAFAFMQLIVLVLLGVGMLHARVLPPVPVALVGFGPFASVMLTPALFLVGVESPVPTLAGLAASAGGLMWLGYVLWREPALDVGVTSADPGPLATA